MQPEMLFGMALGITPPWEVTEVAFSKESSRLDITIDFQRGATFVCPVCSAPAPAYDSTEKEWRLSGPLSQDNKASSLRWCPSASSWPALPRF